MSFRKVENGLTSKVVGRSVTDFLAGGHRAPIEPRKFILPLTVNLNRLSNRLRSGLMRGVCDSFIVGVRRSPAVIISLDLDHLVEKEFARRPDQALYLYS